MKATLTINGQNFDVNLSDDQVKTMNVTITNNADDDADFFPVDGDTYFYVDYDDGDVCENEYDSDDDTAVNHVDLGNCFKTAKRAERQLNKLKYTAQLKKLANEICGRKDGKDVDTYCRNEWREVKFNYEKNAIVAVKCTRKSVGTIRFDTEAHLLDAVNRIGADNVAKYILGVNAKNVTVGG